MNAKASFFIAIVALTMMSCASSYRTIRPAGLHYANQQNCNEKLDVSYVYDIYSMTNNRKYAKKEKNGNYRTIAVRIENLTDTSRLLTTDNFRIYANNRELPIANKTDYVRNVSQLSGLYLLHALWGPWQIESWRDSNGQSGSKTTYIPIGLGVGVINMIIASVANSDHKKEIMNNEIFGRTLQPKETITGIVVLNYSQYEPLVFKYFDK
nr:hypothetical protein [uncultured Carboxylicivirga sp.]